MVNSHIPECSDTLPGRRWSITFCPEQRRAWRSASHQEEVAEVILLVSQPAWRSTAFSLWLSWAVLPGAQALRCEALRCEEAQALRCEEASSPVENSRGLSPPQAGPAPDGGQHPPHPDGERGALGTVQPDPWVPDWPCERPVSAPARPRFQMQEPVGIAMVWREFSLRGKKVESEPGGFQLRTSSQWGVFCTASDFIKGISHWLGVEFRTCQDPIRTQQFPSISISGDLQSSSKKLMLSTKTFMQYSTKYIKTVLKDFFCHYHV